MLCLDAPIRITGERGSKQYSFLQVVYKTKEEVSGDDDCNDKSDVEVQERCKKLKEVQQWLTDKSIIILENEHKFEQ